MNRRLNVIALTGSGISAESGIPTFRGGNGIWDNIPIYELCTPRAWAKDPARVLAFYNTRRAQLAAVEPNEAHRILAEMQQVCNVRIITQNVDNLHERAGSVDVLHLHGELTKVRPQDCYTRNDGYSTEHVVDVGYRPVELGETGGPNDAQLRPHVVFFEEAVPNIGRAMRIVQTADVLLVVGTSMQVYPAALLHTYTPDGCDIYMIDPSDDPAAAILGVTHIRKVATEGMKDFKSLFERNYRNHEDI